MTTSSFLMVGVRFAGSAAGPLAIKETCKRIQATLHPYNQIILQFLSY